jgi:CDP-diacylglycerol--glycerol-3-phosphate 3-phosphatidyltransferase/cardiolipin synthase
MNPDSGAGRGQTTPQSGGRQDRWSVADLLTVSRIPLAVAFVLVPDATIRFVVLALAAATDLFDGLVARRWGSSRLGSFLDPVADKIFMAAAFGVVLVSGALHPLEILGVLARDIMAAIAFFATVARKRASAIPARLGGKIVTVGQLLTLFAFLVDSAYLRPVAWATAGIALYAIWDYRQAAAKETRRHGS